jgi:hypothetical protein
VVVLAATFVVLAAAVVDGTLLAGAVVVVVVVVMIRVDVGDVDVGDVLHDAAATIDSSETATNHRVRSGVIVGPVIQCGRRLHLARSEPDRPVTCAPSDGGDPAYGTTTR